MLNFPRLYQMAIIKIWLKLKSVLWIPPKFYVMKIIQMELKGTVFSSIFRTTLIILKERLVRYFHVPNWSVSYFLFCCFIFPDRVGVRTWGPLLLCTFNVLKYYYLPRFQEPVMYQLNTLEKFSAETLPSS